MSREGDMPFKNREDQSAAAARHYAKNKARIKARAKAHNRLTRERNREFVWEYLKAHPCVDCGESDPIVLTFDHLDSESKDNEVTVAVTQCWSLAKLSSEIAKCEVRCANCHMRRTAIQFDHWKASRSRGDAMLRAIRQAADVREKSTLRKAGR